MGVRAPNPPPSERPSKPQAKLERYGANRPPANGATGDVRGANGVSPVSPMGPPTPPPPPKK